MTRQKLGKAGEKYAVRILRKQNNVLKAYVKHEKFAGDVHAILDTGEIKRIEIKTSLRNADGTFRFTLVKDKHTNHTGADIVVCLCVIDLNFVVPFVIPVSACDDVRVVCIPKNISSYAGKWARFRDNWQVIE